MAVSQSTDDDRTDESTDTTDAETKAVTLGATARWIFPELLGDKAGDSDPLAKKIKQGKPGSETEFTHPELQRLVGVLKEVSGGNAQWKTGHIRVVNAARECGAVPDVHIER